MFLPKQLKKVMQKLFILMLKVKTILKIEKRTKWDKKMIK